MIADASYQKIIPQYMSSGKEAVLVKLPLYQRNITRIGMILYRKLRSPSSAGGAKEYDASVRLA